MNENDPINSQPDVQTGGITFMNSIENLALGGLMAVDQNLANGRMPFDPANPNFGAVRPPVVTSSNSGSPNLLLLGLLLLLVVKF